MQSGFNINLLRVTLYNVDLNQRYLKIHALYSTDDFEFVFFLNTMIYLTETDSTEEEPEM